MNQLQKFTQTAQTYAYFLIVLNNLALIAAWFVCAELLGFTNTQCLLVCAVVALALPIIATYLISKSFFHPLRILWQAIMFVAPDSGMSTPPDTASIHAGIGRELTTNLVNHIYNFGQASSQAASALAAEDVALDHDFVANSLPLPLVVLDQNETILFANKALLTYIGKPAGDVIGSNVYATLDLSFTNDATFDKWLAYAKEQTITSEQTWEHVKLTLGNDEHTTKLFDMAAYYNKNNPDGHETMFVLFDHSVNYGKEDQAIGFVALAVHELRTPLTMLRGYVEALEEELAGKVSPEIMGFVTKMQVSAAQLSSFVNNVLNVARVEDDQMMLTLREDTWETVLKQVTQDLSIRAEVHGIHLRTKIQPDLPTVAIDRVSIYEVLTNLIDNAIKYSGNSKEITVQAVLAQDGMVETSIIDQGVGIPTSAMPHLFQKFYRDPHNRQHVGGTGMGLYLSKKLVGAHGGNIWVRSKEGEGSTFSFTLLPYSQLADQLKKPDNEGIVRTAHGWIKNHSLYRR